MGWDALLIYEMHAKRFTQRNAGARSVFDQLVYELKPDGYLKRLGVTALELLPLHEFPKDNSWGYNPSLFLAIESSYGGPFAPATMQGKPSSWIWSTIIL